MENRPALTTAQLNMLGAIQRLTSKCGYPPTVRELAREVGVRSTNAVSQLLSRLEAKGYIKRRLLLARGITVVGGGER